jgi:hypothetical protein
MIASFYYLSQARKTLPVGALVIGGIIGLKLTSPT